MNEQQALKSSLVEYFSDKRNFDRVIPLINRSSPISLRLLDWFIVCYCRYKRIVYRLEDKQLIDVYASYRAQLKQYSKKYFDPFKRTGRFLLQVHGQSVETTIGQLCFFRWAFQNRVIDYVELHALTIAEDMKRYFVDDSGEVEEEVADLQSTPGKTKPIKKASKKKQRQHVSAIRNFASHSSQIGLKLD